MKKKKLRVQYKYISNRDCQGRLDEAFDLIFEKIEEIKLKGKPPLDKSILDDYNVIKWKYG